MAIFSSFERNRNIERTRSGLAAARARGRVGGRKPSLSEEDVKQIRILLADPEMTVGAVANRSKVYNEEAEAVAEFDGSLSADGAAKAAEFVEFCDAFNIPLVTLIDNDGFEFIANLLGN